MPAQRVNPADHLAPRIQDRRLVADPVLRRAGVRWTDRRAFHRQAQPLAPGRSLVVRVLVRQQPRRVLAHVHHADVLRIKHVHAPQFGRQHRESPRGQPPVVARRPVHHARFAPGHPAVVAARKHHPLVRVVLKGRLRPHRQERPTPRPHHQEVLVRPIVRRPAPRHVRHIVRRSPQHVLAIRRQVRGAHIQPFTWRHATSPADRPSLLALSPPRNEPRPLPMVRSPGRTRCPRLPGRSLPAGPWHRRSARAAATGSAPDSAPG